MDGPFPKDASVFLKPAISHTCSRPTGRESTPAQPYSSAPDGEASSSPMSKAAVKSDDTTHKVWISRSDSRARGKARPSASACGQGQCPGGHGSKVSPVAV